MSWQLHYLIQAVNIGLVHVINMSFPAVRMGLSGNCLLQILVKQIEVKQKLFKQISSRTLARLSNCYCNGMGMTSTFQCKMQLGFTIAM